MKKLAIGIQTSGYWFDETNPNESLRFIKNCGFEAIDYNMGGLFIDTFDKENLTSFFDKSLEELYEYYSPFKKALREEEIDISQVHGLFTAYKQGEEKQNDYYIAVTEKMIAISAYLGCKAIVIHPWSAPELHKEEEKEINLSIYRRMIPAAKKYGVTICLENLFTKSNNRYVEAVCCNISEACWYVDTLNAEAGEEIFGFCLDVGHGNMVGMNFYQFITSMGTRLKVMHIHDNDGNRDTHMIPFTQRDATGIKSVADWNKFTNGIKDSGYEGALSFETVTGETAFPAFVREEALRFICSVGRHFRNRILEQDQ